MKNILLPGNVKINYLSLGVVFLITFALFSVVSCGSDNSTVSMPASAAREMAAWDIQIRGVYGEAGVNLPGDFVTDANWGLKQVACQDAGYDLQPSAGQPASLVGYLTDEYCDGSQMVVWAVMVGEGCVCLFKGHRMGEGPVPGIYSVRYTCRG